ncbi:stage V sporulation protein AF [Alkalibacillus filiformis]|uniref:Stage V sporulation protein AF n=2 Tax=Alkalibacillus filiformis TaxID=200990 RepID=A0ABU0DR34_9BACI|nr:stage V sporulation protein AF [Alkalibacillus filiformis]
MRLFMAKDELKIKSSITENRKIFEEKLGLDVSFDIGYRTIIVLGKEVDFYYVNGLVDTEFVTEILKKVIEINDFEENENKVPEIVKNRLANHQFEEIQSVDDAATEIMSGLLVVLVDGKDKAFVVDVRNYPGRGPEEPDTERVVRGSRDGFTENIIENAGLTRRRVRDENLRLEIMQVGRRSKMDVSIMYIDDIADPGLIETVRSEIEKIDVDGLSMSDKTLEEFILSQAKTPFPLVRYTERPDVASAHLFEGHVLVMVDTSPSVMITPTTYFHHVQHAEEFRQVPFVGTFVRWVRFLGILASLFLLPLWLLFVLEPDRLPENLAYIGPSDEGNVPIVVQALLADLGLEFLRIAAIHTPTAVSTALGLIAAVLIGEIAIEVGLFTPEIILYVAIAAVGSYATPSYELSVANKISRMALVILTASFGVLGLVLGMTLYALILTRTYSLNTPYLWPLIPFNGKALYNILFRVSVPIQERRPSIVHPQDDKRTGSE